MQTARFTRYGTLKLNKAALERFRSLRPPMLHNSIRRVVYTPCKHFDLPQYRLWQQLHGLGRCSANVCGRRKWSLWSNQCLRQHRPQFHLREFAPIAGLRVLFHWWTATIKRNITYNLRLLLDFEYQESLSSLHQTAFVSRHSQAVQAIPTT